MKQDNDWQDISAKEMFERTRQNKKEISTKAGDLGVRVGLLLLMPYIIWLSQYNDSYVAGIHGKAIHFNFDGIMLTLHNLFSNANMLIHESGHGLCYLLPCPQFFMALNGTLFQLALPMLFIYYYYKRGNRLLSGLGSVWLAQNLVYVAWYMSYAQTPNRYPFFLGGNAIHDFWYIFSQLGVLEYDWFISGFVRAVAVMLLLGSYMYLLYIAFLKNENRHSRRSEKGIR
ncbi:MAG: hypothetical protein WBF77_04655 [Sulfurimonadaceae bacterium]